MWSVLQWSVLRSVILGNLGLIAVAVLGMASLVVGSVGLWRVSSAPPTYFIESRKPVDTPLEEAFSSTRSGFMVDVSGAVMHPGIYELSHGSRVQDAVLMAGGFQKDSDVAFIHTSLNLAKKLNDQEKIYIPFKGDSAPNQVSSAPSSSGVFVNLASRREILEWPGIGEKKADSIIAGRPYASLEDFLARSSVTQSFVKDVQEKGMEIEL